MLCIKVNNIMKLRWMAKRKKLLDNSKEKLSEDQMIIQYKKKAIIKVTILNNDLKM